MDRLDFSLLENRELTERVITGAEEAVQYYPGILFVNTEDWQNKKMAVLIFQARVRSSFWCDVS